MTTLKTYSRHLISFYVLTPVTSMSKKHKKLNILSILQKCKQKNMYISNCKCCISITYVNWKTDDHDSIFEPSSINNSQEMNVEEI